MQAGLVSLTAAVVTDWLLRHSDVDARIGLALALIAAIAAAVVATIWALSAARTATTVLEWNGARWALLNRADVHPLELKTIDVMMDSGSSLVLRARSGAGTVHWLTISSRDAPADFRALCRAAYARGPRAALTLQAERQPD